MKRGITIGSTKRTALDAADYVVISSFPFEDPDQSTRLQESIRSPELRLVVDPNPRSGLLVDADLLAADFDRLAGDCLLARISDEDAQVPGGRDLETLSMDVHSADEVKQSPAAFDDDQVRGDAWRSVRAITGRAAGFPRSRAR
ncbi:MULTISPECIES: hypothetical protein [Arthrobacter]|uniref:Uncharacterized protein n=1 Tax=Arthrobacter terricola TaxID=2547396 RepID=A0A4R5K973_9MICC|nr:MULTISPECIES: hypothetical protein [Arthrobacter]MBT8163213.1 hypothetical protein [Arthrobacter sp. GN70]TDF91529.1 hypothetical protein E1809_20595 [Arthrobacter terricola]